MPFRFLRIGDQIEKESTKQGAGLTPVHSVEGGVGKSDVPFQVRLTDAMGQSLDQFAESAFTAAQRGFDALGLLQPIRHFVPGTAHVFVGFRAFTCREDNLFDSPVPGERRPRTEPGPATGADGPDAYGLASFRHLADGRLEPASVFGGNEVGKAVAEDLFSREAEAGGGRLS